MKLITLLFLALFFGLNSAQSQIIKRVADRAKNKVERKAGDKVEKAIDDAVDGKSKNKNENEQNDDANAEVKDKATDVKASDSNNGETEELRAYSKYDFIQGEKVIAYEDFSNTSVGDFPTRWNTNGSAEVVTLNKKEGKWLRINNKGVFLAEFINNLPENSTLEFDLGVNTGFAWGSGYFIVELTHFENREDFSRGSSKPTMHFQFHPLTGENYTGSVTFKREYTTAYMTNEAHIKKWNGKDKLFAHIAIWRQGQRMRLYVNGDKLFDLPRAFSTEGKYTDVVFETHDMQTEKGDYYLLGNIRLAEGVPDTRNKLVTEGKFVTSGITFDVNSDRIKPDSYGVLKEIATVLRENGDLKIKIIGHTDADGDDAKNLELSKKRAAAVKSSLSTEFGIDESRMVTEGQGENKPVGDNTTVEGKAQNRRVEFLKI
jgi:outer membrane protein OmpA-like peptidoglycan-associated protein